MSVSGDNGGYDVTTLIGRNGRHHTIGRSPSSVALHHQNCITGARIPLVVILGE